MSLQQSIEKDFVQAYKAKDEVRVAVLRMLKTAIKNKHVELGRPLENDEILDVVGKQAKQRRESIEQYEKATRPDLVDREKAELAVLESYLPAALSEQELAAAVDEAIAETGAASMKEMGKVMSSLMEKYKGRVDGKQAQNMVRSRLS
ncbi:GatB/YqeY domain-containing protein [Desulfohalovibrio reitneri]|uniref:GatB/YqeY domain-containing protein n=1 Tax=Desulfohalovibrio reitneri TaxID=1307759 RepID=UPI0004A7387C|nr:GatB/YqeY domain-containing protein [Desulfohalovibrio reitneri]